MALFASHRQGAAQSNHLIEIKAGKCQAIPVPGDMDKINIKPLEEPGLIYLSRSDDGLMRFFYKKRDSNVIVDELIVFQSDAIFVPVDENPDARVYLFKFKNSATDRWLFFWMQDGDSSKDEERCKRMNDLLNGDAPPTSSSRQIASFGTPRAGNNAASIHGALSGRGGANAEELMNILNQSGVTREQLQRMLSGSGAEVGRLASLLSSPELLDAAGFTPRSTSQTTRPTGTTPSTAPQVATAGTLTTATPSAQVHTTPAVPNAPQRQRQAGGNRVAADDLRNILNHIGSQANATKLCLDDLFDSGADAIQSRQIIVESAKKHADRLREHLPSQKPIERTEEELVNTLSSPQLRQAVGILDSALQSCSGTPILRLFKYPQKALDAADRADIAALAEGLQSAAIGEQQQQNQELNKESDMKEQQQQVSSSEEQEPSAKRNKPDTKDDKDDKGNGDGAATSDGMELD